MFSKVIQKSILFKLLKLLYSDYIILFASSILLINFKQILSFLMTAYIFAKYDNTNEIKS